MLFFLANKLCLEKWLKWWKRCSKVYNYGENGKSITHPICGFNQAYVVSDVVTVNCVQPSLHQIFKFEAIHAVIKWLFKASEDCFNMIPITRSPMQPCYKLILSCEVVGISEEMSLNAYRGSYVCFSTLSLHFQIIKAWTQ